MFDKKAYDKKWFAAHPDYGRQWHQKHKDERNLRRRTIHKTHYQEWHREYTYGLTPEDYQKLLDKQGGSCALCGGLPKVFRVDHCHATQTVRGLLCHRCNTKLGGIEDSAFLTKALKYLGDNDGSK